MLQREEEEEKEQAEVLEQRYESLRKKFFKQKNKIKKLQKAKDKLSKAKERQEGLETHIEQLTQGSLLFFSLSFSLSHTHIEKEELSKLLSEKEEYIEGGIREKERKKERERERLLIFHY